MLPNPTWYPQVYGRNTPTVLNNQQPTQTPTVFVNGDQARQVDRIILENNGHSANINEIEARFPGPPEEELRTLANRIEEFNQKCNQKWLRYSQQKDKTKSAKEEYEQAKQLLEYDQRNYNSNLEELRNRMPENWDQAEYIVDNWINEEIRNLNELRAKLVEEERKEEQLGEKAQDYTEYSMETANSCMFKMVRLAKNYLLFKADWQDYIGWIKGNLEIWEQRCSNLREPPHQRMSNDNQRQKWRRKFEEVVNKLHLLKGYIGAIQKQIVYFSEKYGLRMDFENIWENEEEFVRAIRWDNMPE